MAESYTPGDITGTFIIVGQPGTLWGYRGRYPCICLRCRRRSQFGAATLDRRPTTCTGCRHVSQAIWHNMIRRCTDPSDLAYQHYGARGISVCDRWLNDFEHFLSDMGYRPCVGLSLDRVNNEGNYEPQNCRWATWKQQRSNQRSRRARRCANNCRAAAAEA